VRAVVLSAPGALSVEVVADPEPGADEVVLAVRDCGICGTDLHLVSGDIGRPNLPLVPGHELWGEIVAVGSAVTRIAVGDTAAVDPSLHCGRCAPCRVGHGNMCDRWGAIGATVAGGWAEYVRAPAANAYLLDDSFPLAAAPLLEPVACVVRGLQRLRPEPDQPAIVVGGGTMGVLLALMLRTHGVGPITIVEINPARRAVAATLTGCDTIAPDELGDLRAPWVIEATGSAGGFTQALDAVARAGSLLVFDVASPESLVPVSPHRIYADEFTIVGSMAILRSFAPAVDAVARHADRFAPLVTHRFGLDDIEAALESVRTGTSIKTVMTP